MYEQIVSQVEDSSGVNQEGITWDNLVNFFTKTLLETKSTTIHNKNSKNTLDKVTCSADEDAKDMIMRMNLVRLELD